MTKFRLKMAAQLGEKVAAEGRVYSISDYPDTNC